MKQNKYNTIEDVMKEFDEISDGLVWLKVPPDHYVPADDYIKHFFLTIIESILRDMELEKVNLLDEEGMCLSCEDEGFNQAVSEQHKRINDFLERKE